MDIGNERPAYPIKPPAMVRHLTFRLHGADNPNFPSGTDEFRESEEDRYDRISRYVSDHLNRLRRIYDPAAREVMVGTDPGRKPRADGRPVLLFDRDRSALIPIVGANDGDDGPEDDFPDDPDYRYRFRVRFDLYSEAYSLTYIFDRFRNLKDDGQLARSLAQFHCNHDDIATDWDGVWDADTGPAAEIERWLNGPSLASTRPGHSEPGRQEAHKVAEFRSAVICPSEDWPVKVATLASSKLAIADRHEISPALTDYIVRNPSIIRQTASPGEFGSNTHRGGESVMCGMIGGTALFVAELAKWGTSNSRVHSRDDSDVYGARRDPIHNLIVYAGHSQAQIGRLVRRCHILGELRHLALFDYDEPGSAGNDLKTVDKTMRGIEKELTDVTVALSEQNKASVDINQVVAEWANMSQMCEGGLIYRVEKSRYYAEEFINTLDHLRIVRLGDWQPYDDFVRRYILQRFARIDRIGNRYTAMGERVSRLMSFKQATELENYQHNVEGTLSELILAIRILNTTTEEVQKASKRQVNLLDEAGYVASVFLIYYIGSILSHFFDIEPKKSFHIPLLGFEITYDGFLVFWLAGAFAALVGLRIAARGNRLKRDAPQASAPQGDGGERAINHAESRLPHPSSAPSGSTSAAPPR